MKITQMPLWIWFGLGGLLLAFINLPAITNTDLNQPRFTRAAPLLNEGLLIQTFVSQHNGLSSVEVRAIVYPNIVPTTTLAVQLLKSNGELVTEKVFTALYHNKLLKLDFAPIAKSKGQEFVIRITGSPSQRLTLWAYAFDGEPTGILSLNNQPQGGDLYFNTHYTYLWPDMLTDSISAIAKLGQWGVVLWLTLQAPGILILSFLRAEQWINNHWARWGVALGLSVALSALAWQWATIVQWRWTGQTLWIAYIIIGLLALIAGIRGIGQGSSRPTIHVTDVVLVFVFLVTFTVRFLAVRDLDLPQWVDSPHHLLVARVLAEKGHLPYDYRPLLPVDVFTYHFGFHSLAVTWQSLTGLEWPDVMLFGGQILNGLISLVAYSSAFLISRSPRAGILAAWVTGWVSLFPAYYVSWGRYTQLTGLLILLLLIAITWRLLTRLQTDKRNWRWMTVLVLLASGLTLTHYRVLFFYATFVLTVLATGPKHGWRWIGVAALVSSLLSLPLLWHLGIHSIGPALASPNTLISPTGYNFFPWDYFRNSLEQGWYAVTGIMLLWGLKRGQKLIWNLISWTIVTSAILNIGPGSGLVNNNSWAISLFVPGALILAVSADDWLKTVDNWLSAPTRLRGYIVIIIGQMFQCTLAVFIGFASAIGLHSQIRMVNPVTTLYTTSDRTALEWIARTVPPEAVFVHNAWSWQNGIWASSDGGAWLWPWLGYRTTLPPIDYSFDAELTHELVNYNERLMQIRDARAPETLALWQEMGVTHIYIGARGGNLKPEMFVGVLGYKLLYTNGAAWVFEIER